MAQNFKVAYSTENTRVIIYISIIKFMIIFNIFAVKM